MRMGLCMWLGLCNVYAVGIVYAIGVVYAVGVVHGGWGCLCGCVKSTNVLKKLLGLHFTVPF